MYKSQQMKDAVRFNSNQKTGTVLRLGPKTPGSTTADRYYRPGVVQIGFIPTICSRSSSAGSDAADNGFDDAVLHVYSKVFLGLRNRRNYSQNQFGLLLKQFTSYVIMHAYLKRLYGIINRSYPSNGYYPKGVLQLLNLTQTDIMDHKDDLRVLVNEIGDKINTLCIPDLPVYRHLYEMVETIYCDDHGLEGQQFLFSPEMLPKWDISSAGIPQDDLEFEMTPLYLRHIAQSSAGFSFSDLRDMFRNVDNAFEENDWAINYALADLANAMTRTDNPMFKFKVDYVAENYTPKFSQSIDDLEKIANINLAGRPYVGAAWITAIIGGELDELHYFEDAGIGINGTVLFHNHAGQVVTTKKGNLSDDLVQWMPLTQEIVAITTQTFQNKWVYNHCGTEICTMADILVTTGGESASAQPTFTIYTISNNTLSRYNAVATNIDFESIGIASNIKYLPAYNLLKETTSTGGGSITWSMLVHNTECVGVFRDDDAKQYFPVLNAHAYGIDSFNYLKDYPAKRGKSTREDKSSRKSYKKDESSGATKETEK